MAHPMTTLARQMASDAGIPDYLVPSVVSRVRAAMWAVERITGYRPLGDGALLLVRRVVDGAVVDYRAGLLARRVT